MLIRRLLDPLEEAGVGTRFRKPIRAPPEGTFVPEAKFALGRLLITPGAQAALAASDVWNALARHAQGDWGELSEEDQVENEFSMARELRLLSAYRSEAGVKFWIITEADRSVTSVLLPEEY